jgi:hypothetical protein
MRAGNASMKAGNASARGAERASKRPKPLAVILVKRSSILLLVLSAVSGFFWTVGSFTGFLDDTQVLLLTILRYCGMALALTAGVGAALSAGISVAKPTPAKALGILGYLVLCAVGAAALFLANAVLLLYRGVGSP